MFVYEIHATFANILTSKHVAGHRFLAQAPKTQVFENPRTLPRTFGREEFFVACEEDRD